jgi:GNAT superfamily N-acetyltransferase
MDAEGSVGTQLEKIVSGHIRDRQGKAYSYKLTILDESRNWTIFDGEWRIGYAWCGCYGADFRIGDLRFEPAFRAPRRGWRRYFLRKAPPVNYRQRGLGSALLPLLIVHARESGCKKVSGMLSEVDLVPFPALAEWYARFGFRSTLSMGKEPEMGTIELPL